MEKVSPIKSVAEINQIWEILKVRSDRDALLFRTGINTGFRISDILGIRVKDVRSSRGVINKYIYIRERKTKKHANRVIQKDFGKELLEYIDLFMLDPDDFLFFKQLNTEKAISRQYAWLRLKKAAYRAGVDNFGTHTLRKTFGYFAYKKTKNIALVMRLLNHSSAAVTLRYIGVDQSEQDKFLLEEWDIWD